MALKMMLAAAMLCTIGHSIVIKPDMAKELNKATSGISFNGEPIILGKVVTKSYQGAQASMNIGPHQCPVYDVSDEPFGRKPGQPWFSKVDFDNQGEAFNGNKCSPAMGRELANKHLARSYPQAARPSVFPEGSHYAKMASVNMSGSTYGCTGGEKPECAVPVYMPARKAPETDQKIPRTIWMTVPNKMLTTGPFQFNLLAEWMDKNPEYEFVASNDNQSDAFMASGEIKPAWAAAYKKARNGAEKADIWRYAVMHVYGGVYMDTDMKAQKALSEIIDGKADVVQQLTKKGTGSEIAQYGLFFAKGHPLMEAVLDDIVLKLADPSSASMLTLKLTGPGALARVFDKISDVFGLKSCKGKAYHVCGKGVSIEAHEKFGKVMFLDGGRDFNCGVRWHKADTCALVDSRVPRWTHGGKATGGH